jgi:lipopolysaccharide/colanic/teichoic acid biosynthesis glycosyltransferase
MQSDFAKRAFELFIVAASAIIWVLALLLLSVLVRLKLGSPVFFKQLRPGLNCVPFTLIKFRTMTDERGPDGLLLPDADRLTRFGRFLRSTSLDELPEILNVLKGDMSLVGPRPLLMRYLPRYSAYQMRRHEARPGITGWAQINGRNAISWEQKFALDVWYVENRSLFLDLKILILTLKAVVFREGINAPKSATMPEFYGSNPN